MDKAKQAISDFTSKHGQHNTVIDQDQRRAITEEHVYPSRHEEVTTAVDREVHQDHHRTVIQPIKTTEKMPEKHHHNLIPVEHKSYEHDNVHDARDLLDKDANRYRDSSTTHDVTHTSANVPIVASEHVHHHFHDHVQPVITKEVVRPEVVHTTVPIHEVHHAATVNHGTTTLPEKTWEEFEKAKGTMAGRSKETIAERKGCANDYARETEGQRTSTLTDKGSRKEAAVGAAGLAAAAGAARAEKERDNKDTTTNLVDRTNKNNNSALDRTIDDTAANDKQRNLLHKKAPLEKDATTTGAAAAATDATGRQTHATRNDKAALENANTTDRTSAFFRSPEQEKAAAAGTKGHTKSSSLNSTGSAEQNYKMSGSSAKPTTQPQTLNNKAATGTTATDNAVPRTASDSSAGRKISLKDKLNPFKDADGDGKKGIMS